MEIKKYNSKESLTGLYIAPDKVLFSIEKYWYFSYFSMKTYVLVTH